MIALSLDNEKIHKESIILGDKFEFKHYLNKGFDYFNQINKWKVLWLAWFA